MTMDDLVAAGAPALPAPLFYRVRMETPSMYGLVRVEIREPWLIGSSRVECVRVSLYDHPDVMSAVVRACQIAVDDMEERSRMRRLTKRATELDGDYGKGK